MICDALILLYWAHSHSPRSVELTKDDIAKVWYLWLFGFAGTGKGDGWLGGIGPEARTSALESIPAWVPETVAALVWLAVDLRTSGGRRDRILAWQPVLSAALDFGLVEPTDNTAAFLTLNSATKIDREQIDTDMLQVIEFMDNALWCEHVCQELGIARP